MKHFAEADGFFGQGCQAVQKVQHLFSSHSAMDCPQRIVGRAQAHIFEHIRLELTPKVIEVAILELEAMKVPFAARLLVLTRTGDWLCLSNGSNEGDTPAAWPDGGPTVISVYERRLAPDKQPVRLQGTLSGHPR